MSDVTRLKRANLAIRMTRAAMPHGSKISPAHNTSLTTKGAGSSTLTLPDIIMENGFEDHELSKYIHTFVKKRVCDKYVPQDKEYRKNHPITPPLTSKRFHYPPIPGTVSIDEKDEGPVNAKCHCGYPKNAHTKDALDKQDPAPESRDDGEGAPPEWKVHQHTTRAPTDAYGEIEFEGYAQRISKYVRVDQQTDMETMLTLMTQHWRLPRPNLLISVTGGAKNFTMRPRLKEVFRRGLMKAAESTGAWIITGGMHAGVMKHVGEAARDYAVAHGNKKPAIVIGISPWGAINNKECLVAKHGKGLWPATYKAGDPTAHRQSPIDPNHTHFVMIDNATQHMFATEIAFRARLEGAICAGAGDASVSIPGVCVVLEGGPGTLETVKSAIQNGTPAVIVEGSGRAADVLAFAYANSSEEEFEMKDKSGKTVKKVIPIFDNDLWDKVREKIISEWRTSRDIDSRVNWVRECLEKRDHMTVFQLEGASSVKDIDLAMLQALMKVRKDKPLDQLKLALAWNRIDVAKSEIFTDDAEWFPGELDGIMFRAIVTDRMDFVDLFMEHGVSLKTFLTVRRLLQLYNEIPENSLLYQLLKRKRDSKRRYFSLYDVGQVIQDLTGDYYQPKYLKSRYKNLDADRIITLPDEGSTEKVPVKKHASLVKTKSAKFSPDIDIDEDERALKEGAWGFDDPARELFIWCVLNNRQNMAMLFWEEGKEDIAAALTAQKMVKTMRTKTEDSELHHALAEQSVQYSSLALGVLGECYTMDEKRTGFVLVRELNNFGQSTVIQLAVEADNKRFIAHAACQALINRIWMGRMTADNGLLKLWLCMLLPVLIFPLVKFQRPMRPEIQTTQSRSKPKAIENASKEEEEKRPMTSPHPRRESHVEAPSDKRDRSGLAWWEKIVYFFNAPSITFYYNCVSYIFFLLVYSYVLLIEFTEAQMYPNDVLTMSAWEIFLIITIGSLLIEELRQLISSGSTNLGLKFRSYFTDVWNILDIIAIITFIAGLSLRCIPPSTCPDCFVAARIIYGLNIMTFFFRILHMFSIHKMLGPKMVMIGRMMLDLVFFMVILLVFVLSYGVATQAILYPGAKLEIGLLRSVLQKPYFQIFGELFLEELEGDMCPNEPCPEKTARWFVPMLLGIYILITNVLMLNLLIAMFSYTFSMIQDRTDQHWMFQRYFLIKEYYDRPPLVPPLILLSHVFLVVRWMCQKCCAKCRNVPNVFKVRFNEQEDKQLTLWENMNADEFLRRTQAEDMSSQEHRIKDIDDRVETIGSKVDEMAEVSLLMQTGSQSQSSQYKLPPVLDDRLTYLEEQLKATTKALSWVVDSLADKGMGKGQKPQLPDIDAIRAAAREKKDQEMAVKREEFKAMLERQVDLHVKSRTSRYPSSNPEMVTSRFPVTDDKVHWDVEWLEYQPVYFTDPEIKARPSYADKEELLAYDPDKRPSLAFNQLDSPHGVDRRSLCGEYQVVFGLPLNPQGRTGLCGRGVLGRWGPNKAGDPIVTRWLREDLDNKIVKENNKPVLEFVSIQRSDTKEWAIPGGILQAGHDTYDCLKAEFTEEALGDTDDVDLPANINDRLKELWKHGEEVYSGYADDHRNTDNAWIETVAVNYHDEKGDILKGLQLKAGNNVELVRWQRISSRQPLYGVHMNILQRVAEKHKAAF